MGNPAIDLEIKCFTSKDSRNNEYLLISGDEAATVDVRDALDAIGLNGAIPGTVAVLLEAAMPPSGFTGSFIRITGWKRFR